MIKIGRFLAELRQNDGLTQEQLGEELGVTNKTISRWECGNYLPPAEMLLALSKKYGVTVNDILSGERLSPENYPEKAEENLTSALRDSAFSLRERIGYYSKKWDREHLLSAVIGTIILFALLGLCIALNPVLIVIPSEAAAVWAILRYNFKRAYVERKAFKPDDSRKKN